MTAPWRTMVPREFHPKPGRRSRLTGSRYSESGKYPQDMFTLRSVYYLGRPPAAHMYWRRYEVSKIPLSSLEAFDEWLNARWHEKDALLDHHAKHQCFPSSLPGKRSIHTTVRLGRLWEVWKIFILPIVMAIGIVLKYFLLL
jgi:hypothetical protein